MLSASSALPAAQQWPIKGFATIQTKIIEKHTNESGVFHQATFSNIDTDVSFGETCFDGTKQWMQEMILGNTANANAVASAYYDKGSRGQAIGFFSKQLGLPYPPIQD